PKSVPLVAEAEAAESGRGRNDLPTVSADSSGGMSSGRMRLLLRNVAGFHRRLLFTSRHARAQRADPLGSTAHGRNSSNVRSMRYAGSKKLTSAAILPSTLSIAQEFFLRA